MNTPLPLDWDREPPTAKPVAPLRPSTLPWAVLAMLFLAIIFGQPAKALLFDDPSPATGLAYADTVNHLAEDGILLSQAQGYNRNNGQPVGRLIINHALLDAQPTRSSGPSDTRPWLHHCRGAVPGKTPGAIKADDILPELLGWLTSYGRQSSTRCAMMVNLFRSQTFLAEDMAAGCNNESWACNGRPTILPSLRQLRLDPDTADQPDILFSDGEQLELMVSQTEGQPGEEEHLPLVKMAPAAANGNTDDLRTYLVGRPQDSLGAASAYCFRQANSALSNEPTCLDGVGVWLLGDRVLLTMGPRFFATPGWTVTRDGIKLTAVRHNADAVTMMDENQRVTVAFGATEKIALRLVRSRPTLDQDPSLASLAHDLATAQPRGSDPLITSLDQKLQKIVQDLLDEAASESTDELTHVVANWHQEGSPPEPDFRASVTLMDATTGEIHALGTWPYSPEQVVHGRSYPTAAALGLTRGNANFIRMPIGSTAKIPFAAAIIAANPSLITADPCGAGPGVRRLNDDQWHDYADSTDRVANGPLDWKRPWEMAPDEIEQCNGPNVMGFRSFIAQSSNAYAVNLMLHMRPRGRALFRLERDGLSPSEEPASSQFLRNLWKMACVAAIEVEPNHSDQNDYGWQSRLPAYCSNTLFPDREFVNGGQSPVVRYDRVFLNAENISDATALPDFLMNILGGSRSTWTTINLAEAYSRIVTNTAVQARLMANGSPVPASMVWPAGDGLRQELLQGMMGVILSEQSGTARGAGIREALGPEFAGYLVYAKTGTPKTTLRSLGGNSLQRLQQHLDAGCAVEAYRENGHAALRFETSSDSRCPHERIAIYEGDNEVADYLYTQDGRIFSLPQDVRPQFADGHAFVVVICNPSGQSCKTIAINIQWRSETNRIPAARLAADLLRQPEVRRWLRAPPPTNNRSTAS